MSIPPPSGNGNPIDQYLESYNTLHSLVVVYFKNIEKRWKHQPQAENYLTSRAHELFYLGKDMTFEDAARLYARYKKSKFPDRIKKTVETLDKNLADITEAYSDLQNSLKNSSETSTPPTIIEPTKIGKFNSDMPGYDAFLRREIEQYKFPGQIVPLYISQTIDSVIEKDIDIKKFVSSYNEEVNFLKTEAVIENAMLHARYNMTCFRMNLKEQKKRMVEIAAGLTKQIADIWGQPVITSEGGLAGFLSGLAQGAVKTLYVALPVIGITFVMGGHIALDGADKGVYVTVQAQQFDSYQRQLNLDKSMEKINQIYIKIKDASEELVRRYNDAETILASGAVTTKLADDAVVWKRHEMLQSLMGSFITDIKKITGEYHKVKRPTENDLAGILSHFRGALVTMKRTAIGSIKEIYEDPMLGLIYNFAQALPDSIKPGKMAYLEDINKAFIGEYLKSEKNVPYFYQQFSLYDYVRKFSLDASIDDGTTGSLLKEMESVQFSYLIEKQKAAWKKYDDGQNNYKVDFRESFSKSHPYFNLNSLSLIGLMHAASLERINFTRNSMDILTSELAEYGTDLNGIEEMFANDYGLLLSSIFSSLILKEDLFKISGQMPKNVIDKSPLGKNSVKDKLIEYSKMSK